MSFCFLLLVKPILGYFIFARAHTAAQARSPQIQKTNDRLALHESALKTPVYVVVLLFLHFQRVKVLAKSRKKYVWNCEKDGAKS